MPLARDDIREAIFGISDGAATTIGAMFGLYALGDERLSILVSVLSVGASSVVSMGSAEYISDDESDVSRAVAMVCGTAIGGLTPAIPYVFLGGLTAIVLSAAIVAVLGCIVAEARAKIKPRRMAYLQVYATFIVVAALTTVLGLVV